MAPKLRDFTGLQVGGLYVISRASARRSPSGRTHPMWNCRCHCGNELVVYSPNLRRTPAPIGCGCTSPGRRKPGTYLRAVVQKTRYGATSRSLEYSLEDAELEQLVRSNCHYCGEPPKDRPSHAPGAVSDRFATNGVYRVDNEKGYVRGNCVPCCGDCNQMKMDYSIEEFKARIRKLFEWVLSA